MTGEEQYLCERGEKIGSQYFTIFDAGARKGDYNDLPSVKYFLDGTPKRMVASML